MIGGSWRPEEAVGWAKWRVPPVSKVLGGFRVRGLGSGALGSGF